MSDVCDYCGTWLEDGTQTYPIYVGEQGVQIVSASAMADKLEKVMRYGKRDEFNDGTEVLEERVDFAQAIIRAIKKSNNFSLNKYRSVATQTEENFMMIGETEGSRVSSHEVDEGKISVEIEAITENQSEPDMMVCEHCRNELGDGVND